MGSFQQRHNLLPEDRCQPAPSQVEARVYEAAGAFIPRSPKGSDEGGAEAPKRSVLIIVSCNPNTLVSPCQLGLQGFEGSRPPLLSEPSTSQLNEEAEGLWALLMVWGVEDAFKALAVVGGRPLGESLSVQDVHRSWGFVVVSLQGASRLRM